MPERRPHSDVVKRYLEWFQLGLPSPNTVIVYGSILTRLDEALPAGLIEASAEDLATWQRGLALSHNSIRLYMATTRGFYKWACAAGLRKDDPMKGLPSPRKRRMIPRPIPEEDLFEAIMTAPIRIRAWLVLAAYAGLRACEIAYLRREDILDTARPRMLIVSAQAAKGSVERIVPLSDDVWGELVAAGVPRRGWMFPRADGHPGPNRPSRVSQLVNDHLHSLGIHSTLHKLRHYFGTETHKACHDIRIVQELMGHASLETTGGYTAHAPADAVAAVNAIQPSRRRRGLRAVSDDS